MVGAVAPRLMMPTGRHRRDAWPTVSPVSLADSTPAGRKAADRLLPPGLMIVGATSMYLGAAVAVGLFDAIEPAGVAWLRIAGAAVVLVLWVRPGRAAWHWRRLRLASAFGLMTAAMNIAFYEALDHLPLGSAVALEFLGPIAVVVAGSRTRRDLVALVFAVVGVMLIADVRWSGTAWGVILALTAATCWAGYIVLGKKVAQRGSGVEDLATGFVMAALLTSPLIWLVWRGIDWDAPGWQTGGDGASIWAVLCLGLAVGAASSAVPYGLDQVVLRRIGAGRFALLMALLPVTAVVIGFLALGQVPHSWEIAGIVCVAVAVAVRTADPDEGEVESATDR